MPPAPELLAIARNLSDLAPYVGVLALGFLIGAWGQSARVPTATLIGLLLIMLAVGAFILEPRLGRQARASRASRRELRGWGASTNSTSRTSSPASRR